MEGPERLIKELEELVNLYPEITKKFFQLKLECTSKFSAALAGGLIIGKNEHERTGAFVEMYPELNADFMVAEIEFREVSARVEVLKMLLDAYSIK